MTREQKIVKLLSANSATPQTNDHAIFHTKDMEVAKWAIKNGMHVQGINGVLGYSAFIWIDEPATKESFIKYKISKMKRINFYIPSDLLEKAKARAEEMNLNSLAALVRLAITEYLKK